MLFCHSYAMIPEVISCVPEGSSSVHQRRILAPAPQGVPGVSCHVLQGESYIFVYTVVPRDTSYPEYEYSMLRVRDCCKH